MSQKSSKNLSTLSKHMSNDTKLQVNTNTVTNKLIIPVLSGSNANPTNEKYMLIVQLIIYLFTKIMLGYKLYNII